MNETVVTGGLTREEEDLLIELLSKVTQPYSARFFEALAKLVPVLGIEVVVMHPEGDTFRVLLTQRPDTSPSWPGMWQSPGSILRESDESLDEVLTRLEENEFGAELWNLRLAYFIIPPRDGVRARNAQLVYVADLPRDAPHNGTWFYVDELPEPMIGNQAAMVHQVAHLMAEGLLVPASR